MENSDLGFDFLQALHFQVLGLLFERWHTKHFRMSSLSLNMRFPKCGSICENPLQRGRCMFLVDFSVPACMKASFNWFLVQSEKSLQGGWCMRLVHVSWPSCTKQAATDFRFEAKIRCNVIGAFVGVLRPGRGSGSKTECPCRCFASRRMS